MKNLVKLIVVFLLMILFTCNANASEMVTIRANKYTILNLEVNKNYYIDVDSNRLMIPMSMAREVLGLHFIGHDKVTNQKIFRLFNKEIRLTVGDKQAFIDGVEYTMDAAPQRKENILESMFIPIRILIDNFGIEAEWNHEWKELSLVDERFPVERNIIDFGLRDYQNKDDYAMRLVSYTLLDDNNPSKISVTFENISGSDFGEPKNYLPYLITPTYSGLLALDVNNLKKEQRRTYEIEPNVNINSTNFIFFDTVRE